jgi:NAD(P)-dependent dehydrogenase (short-subunit alcohol dehydrogenase family)
MTFQGRVAAITGASSGIGLACAEELARLGASVVLGARRADRLAEAVDRIRRAGGRAEAVTMDVASEADVQSLVSHAERVFGGLDIMICNAGFGYYGTVEESAPDVVRRLMDVNFMGTYHGARAAMPIFRRQGRGHLVIVSSIAGRRGIPLMSAYCATKAAQIGFAESLRSEFAKTPIHVSVVLPVSTETEFRSAMQRDYGYTVAGLGPKQTVAKVAAEVIDCLRRPRVEVYPHAKSRALAILNVVAPELTDRLVRRYGRRRLR